MKHVDALRHKMKAFETLQKGNYCGLTNHRWNLSTPETTVLKCSQTLALPTYLMRAMKQTSRVCLLHAFMSCSYTNFYLLVLVQYFDGPVFSVKAFLSNQWCADPFHYFPVSLRHIADDPLHIVVERKKILPCLFICISICQLSSVLILSCFSKQYHLHFYFRVKAVN